MVENCGNRQRPDGRLREGASWGARVGLGVCPQCSPLSCAVVGCGRDKALTWSFGVGGRATGKRERGGIVQARQGVMPLTSTAFDRVGVSVSWNQNTTPGGAPPRDPHPKTRQHPHPTFQSVKREKRKRKEIYEVGKSGEFSIFGLVETDLVNLFTSESPLPSCCF